MKKGIIIIRWLVGLLFIFSGLIKANDPLGLSYKMQEFFEAWNLKGFDDYTLFAAINMNILEITAGIAVIVGWQMKRFSWLLLALITFFTFLTGYVLLSGKIHACGCFGDCLPLTPIQTFTKDIILLVLIIIVVYYSNTIKSKFSKIAAVGILLFAFLFSLALQFYVQAYLPIIDCLPYAKGKNILQEMQLPPNATKDSVAIQFNYKKDGKIISFDQNNFPADFDSTYEYVDRVDKLIKKGSGLPKIVDFSLTTLHDNDTTNFILQQPNFYVLFFVKDFNRVNQWKNNNFDSLISILSIKHIPYYLVTADVYAARDNFTTNCILKCDATVIKTAARVVPTYFLMKGATIVEKRSDAQIKQFMEKVNGL